MNFKSLTFLFAVVILTFPTRAADRSKPAPAPSLVADTPAVADPRTFLADLRLELEKSWPTNHTLNLVCHGHSVPAGYARTPEVHTFDAYPHLLHVGLNQRYPHSVVNVIVTAIGGEQSEQGAARFDRDVLALHPDLITIDYALNDRRIGLERSERAWRSMIEKARARRIPVILLTPTADQSAHLDDPADPLNQHAAQIRRLAAEYHLALVDSLAQFQDYVQKGGKLADLMAQGNHPNRAGHELVVKQLLNWF